MEILRTLAERTGLVNPKTRYLVESEGEQIWSFKRPSEDTKIYAVAHTEMTPLDFHLLQVTIFDTNFFSNQSQVTKNVSESFPQHKKDNLEIIFPRGEFADECSGVDET